MSKRIKNIVAILVFLFLVLGAGLFFFYRWMMRLPRTEGELYDSFCVRMDKKYGDGEDGSVVRMETGEYVLVLLGRQKGGDEAVYEIYKTDERQPGQNAWNGPVKKGTVHMGDDPVQISRKIKNQPEGRGFVRKFSPFGFCSQPE